MLDEFHEPRKGVMSKGSGMGERPGGRRKESGREDRSPPDSSEKYVV